MVIHRHAQNGQNVSRPTPPLPTEIEQGYTLLSYSKCSSHIVSILLVVYLGSRLHTFVLFVSDFAVENVP